MCIRDRYQRRVHGVITWETNYNKKLKTKDKNMKSTQGEKNMIKRFNKTTSLLIAAATVASMVPATGVMAADYKRIAAEEGTIYTVIAHKDGFVVDGNLVDEDTDAVYYLKDGKYTELEDVDSGVELDIYGEKYADIDDADYYLDLTTGKLTEDDLEEDAIDDAESALRKKIKSVDRYNENDELPTLVALPSNKFVQGWYKDTTTYSTTIFTDAEGNYIDTDYNLGKIKVNFGEDSVNIENTDDQEKVESTTVDAAVVGGKVLAQDSDYIYRLATIKLESNQAITGVYGKGTAKTTTDAGATLNLNVIQKISKAQASDEVDDAKYAKSVTNYIIADEDGDTCDKSEDFVTLAGNDDAVVSVINGKLVVSYFNDGEVTAQTLTLKSKRGFYYTEAESDSTEDAVAVDTDVNGNVYRLDGGYVYKFDNTDDWTKLYKVDGAMEEINVYDEDNMVVWNEDDEVYSIIASESATTEETEETEEVAAKTGWAQNADGTWNYFNADGSKATGWVKSPASGIWYYMNANGVMMTNGWVKDNGVWYYLQANGAMKTGWLKDGANWYYLQASGAMKTGWLNDRGTWYYLNGSGAMLSNTTVNGYVLGANGAWIRQYQYNLIIQHRVIAPYAKSKSALPVA
eukprot:TRINITY_DN1919_c0_g3_i1.p1 TRINITY_DN1919_c0_g3~~TRINITY_DN1919_c0_g3_i1.p1  ORF type:complete len:631 (+),score=153.04 TRINITY_DN1919_c0_g3_i1:76-1968(+)